MLVCKVFVELMLVFLVVIGEDDLLWILMILILDISRNWMFLVDVSGRILVVMVVIILKWVRVREDKSVGCYIVG